MTLKSPLSHSPMNQLVDQLRKRLLESQDIDDYLIHSLLCSDNLNHSLMAITKYYQEHLSFQHIEVWRKDANHSLYHQIILMHHQTTVEYKKNPQLLDLSGREDEAIIQAPDPLFFALCNLHSTCQEIVMVEVNSLTKNPYVIAFFFEKKQAIHYPIMKQASSLIGGFIDTATLALPNNYFYDQIRSVPLYLHPFLALEQFRDFSLRKHSYSVMRLAEKMASELGLSPIETNQIRIAAFLHDIGKMLLPQNLLQKQDHLSEDEYKEVQNHVVYSTDMAILFGLDSHVQQIIYEHHERYDGSGYPEGKKGKKLLLASSILGVADVYTALQEHRPYQNEHESSKALDELFHNPNNKYDPQVIQALVKILT